jgi:hypothetical protein
MAHKDCARQPLDRVNICCEKGLRKGSSILNQRSAELCINAEPAALLHVESYFLPNDQPSARLR